MWVAWGLAVATLSPRTQTIPRTGQIVNKSILKRKRVGRFGTALDGVKKELSIWKKLNHDNVVNLVEIIDDPGV